MHINEHVQPIYVDNELSELKSVPDLFLKSMNLLILMEGSLQRGMITSVVGFTRNQMRGRSFFVVQW